MNNLPFIYPNNYEQSILMELKKINETLQEIAKQLSTINTQKENNYLKKDNTYHIL